MTCLIGVVTADNRAIVAADTCITWSWPNSGSKVYQDELQKIYGLSPQVVVVVSGDLLPAQEIIHFCNEHAEEIRQRSIDFDQRIWLTGKFLARLFDRAMSTQPSGHVSLIYGVAVASGDVRLFAWNSAQGAKAFRQLGPGEVVMMGSVRDDPSLTTQLEARLTAIATSESLPRISDEQLVALFADTVTNTLSGAAGRKVGVGGLFQIATADGTEWFIHGFECHALAANETGQIYNVQLVWRPQTGRWYQCDETSGKEFALLRLDEHDFRRSPSGNKVFEYG